MKYEYDQSEDVNRKDLNGNIAINMAIASGKLEVVKYLCETCHADVEAKDKFGRSPIALAALYERKDVVEYLQDKLVGRNKK